MSQKSATHELLTKADILRQYRVPKTMLDEAIVNGELRSIDGPLRFRTGSSADGKSHWRYPIARSRFYIPRHTVEKWIDKKVRA